MSPPHEFSSDIAFTPTVKAIQQRKGSRHGYAQMEARGGWQTVITPNLAAFVADVRSFFLATVNSDGQPYIQHRGGPPGFLKVLDETTLAITDFRGNRQYISQGNLAESPKAFIFLIDYQRQRRIKIWGTARVVEDDPDLLARLTPKGYSARPEQALLFTLKAWDANCPRHIPQSFEAEDVNPAIAKRDARIAKLEARLEVVIRENVTT